MCNQTCRHRFPYEPELWCPGCTEAEAADREANHQRWLASETRREVLEIVKERLEREAGQ